MVVRGSQTRFSKGGGSRALDDESLEFLAADADLGVGTDQVTELGSGDFDQHGLAGAGGAWGDDRRCGSGRGLDGLFDDGFADFGHVVFV